MVCDVCKKNKYGISWSSGVYGTLALCQNCAESLQNELIDLTTRLRQREDLDSLLREVLKVAQHVTHADMGNIQLLDQQGVLRVRTHNGFQSEFLEFFSSVEENEAACGSALASRKTVIVEDVERSPIFVSKPSLNIMRRAGVRAVLSTPMFNQSGNLIGIFSTHYHEPRQFNEREVQLLAFLARQAADLIDEFQVAGGRRAS